MDTVTLPVVINISMVNTSVVVAMVKVANSVIRVVAQAHKIVLIVHIVAKKRVQAAMEILQKPAHNVEEMGV